jgi:hypothetical protein
MGGFGAPFDCALRSGRLWDETIPHNGANDQGTKSRAIRGQWSMWFCLRGCGEASNTVVWPLSSVESLGRAFLTHSTLTSENARVWSVGRARPNLAQGSPRRAKHL